MNDRQGTAPLDAGSLPMDGGNGPGVREVGSEQLRGNGSVAVHGTEGEAGRGVGSAAGGAIGHDGAGGVVTRPGFILALDPGPAQTGWALYDGERVHSTAIERNDAMLERVHHWQSGVTLAIEMIASYGMPVGREVFETCLWIGRFMQAWHSPEAVRLVYRKDVKLHLCGTTKAKDANVRQALLDLFPRTGGGATPQVGTKGKPGPLYGVSTHAWPALGVAVTVQAQMRGAARV